MVARARYELKAARGRDVVSLEIVDLTDLEVVLFWDCFPKEARRMEEAIRRDLLAMEPDEFLDRWSAARPEDFA